MAWSGSAMFAHFVSNNLLRDPDEVLPTGYTNIQANTLKAALYNNSITPDKNATLIVQTAYNGSGGQWLTTNEVTGGANWPSGGVALTGNAITRGSGYAMFDAADTTHSSTVTISNAYGCLVYNDSTSANPPKQGITYHYFGGAQSVTSGTFTIIWHADGLFRITV